MNKRYIQTFILLFALFLGAANDAWALSTTDIIIESTTHGTVAVTSVNNATRTVTITVTPASGYYVNKSDIIVQKLVDPSLASARRTTPGIANALTVSGPTSSKDPAEYTFVVPADYAGALVTVTFTGMNPATATVTPNSLIYTSEAQELVTLGTVVGGAATNPVTYSLSSGGPYTTAIPTGTNAGTYTVYYKVAGDATHAEGSGSVSVTINKAQITSVELSNNAISYDGNPHTVNVTNVKAGTLLVPSNDYTFSGNTATAIGTHTVTVTVKNESVNFTGTATATFRIVEQTVTIINSSTAASSVTDLTGHYLLMGNISASVLANLYSTTNDFTGIFEVGSDNDGNFYTIDMNGYNHALFNTINGGTVKNVMLKNVAISSSADAVGAIAGTAKGYSRIYNCGILPKSKDFPEGTHPSVSTSGDYAGGIVGSLEGDSRVINCFSYADVSAATTAAGIVGNNTFASTAEETDGKYTKLRTAVVNCMFYGNITGGTNQHGVYGGQLITNADANGINSYNYYRSGTSFTTTNGEPTAYNCSFPAEERYLTQVEFHRSLLNSNRELCGWWVGAPSAPSGMSTTAVQDVPKDASLMAKWVLDPSMAPYPILKKFGKYASPVNIDADASWRITANQWEGKKLGTIKVTIDPGDHAASGVSAKNNVDFIITDMDTLRADYCYRKIRLPYYNTVFGNPNGADWAAKYAGNYTSYVVTGWKVTAVTTDGTVTYNAFTPDWQVGYNYADRKCTAKDIYSDNNKRVFAQGGYYYVPDGVTGITIEAYWGKAVYVRNNGASYDRVNITLGNTGSAFSPAGIRDNNVNGATIQTTTKLSDALTATNIDAKKTIYDYALVLVGNVQESVGNSNFKHATQDTRGFTIMSVDLDFDEEPDYCLEWQLGNNMTRKEISPIRFDFLPVVELGIAGKLNGSTNFFSFGCYRSKGHFEVTETAFIRFGQFEFELNTRDEGPIILNGGIYDQYSRGRNDETTQNINYVILGGHIIMPSFTPGAHVNAGATYQTRHCAVNALGGDFTSFYLTGGYNEGIEPFEDNPHCYIDGGHFGTIAAAYKEGIWGDVTWRINHALINEFYGGGVMAQSTGSTYKIVKGNIDVVIDNSTVGKYCGGPKFGDMVSGKTVKTSATNTVFTQYFGAGNGGTTYIQYDKTDDSDHGPLDASTWNSTVSGKYHVGKYRSKAQGYEADYDIEVLNTSTGDLAGRVINRSYYYSAQFATTNTGNVTNTLTGCTIETSFYGGGFLGGVDGSVTSTLTDCTVNGNVYGAGYSASAGTVTIHNIDKTPPLANINTGIIKPQSGGTSTTYHWTNDKGSTGSPITAATGSEEMGYFYTEIPLNNLGAVTGAVILTITTTGSGESIIGTIDDDSTGHVYGGGDASAVSNTTSPANASTTVNISGNTQVLGNVYGGGNRGLVSGNATVNIRESEPITTP